MADTTRNSSSIVQAPLYPLMSDVASAIRSLDGEPIQRARDLLSALSAQMGTPQNPVDWSDPDIWIGERLTGDLRVLAKKIWESSGKTLNPRYLNGCYLFINRLHLLDQDGGIYRIGGRARRFLEKDDTILRELDAIEGIPKLLSLVAERSPCKRGDILPAWSDYLKAVSLFSTPKTFADTLRRRLIACAERGLISREGNYYAITDAGLKWLKGFSIPVDEAVGAVPSRRRTTVSEAAHAHNDEQLKAFRSRLMQLEPVQFEHFVKELLDAMDYEDVHVTKATGDKGVDVVARVQIGITEITEVVQVKRTEITIVRPKIDELRGALPYHKAIRGTIISLGDFAKGAKDGAIFPGAAPITLIDGKRLLDLCVKHEVGIKKRPVEIYEIDEAFFAEKFSADEVEEIAPITNGDDG